jgi:hypothetical protein
MTSIGKVSKAGEKRIHGIRGIAGRAFIRMVWRRAGTVYTEVPSSS